MGVNNDYPVLDGISPSWADIEAEAMPIGGQLLSVKDFAAIHTGTSVEVGEQEGASGGRVMKRTTGRVKNEFSITLYRDGYLRLLRGLKGLAPKRGNQRLISLVHFDIKVQHTPIGSVDIFEYRAKGLRIIGRTLDGAEGTSADTVEVPCSVITIADMIDGEEVVLL